MAITVIRSAAWAIAWDEASKHHVYVRDADIGFAGDSLIHVGGGYTGRVDTEIDGRGRMVMPGLVDIMRTPGTRPRSAASARSMACRANS